ncbi:MAG: sodium-dependent transporter [Succinivibrionaceae bacterium]
MSGLPKEVAIREGLSSRLGFILLSAGCAIGLGNIWRFPYVVGENGGAIFVFIYFACLLLLGLPALMIELALGRASKKSIAKAFETLEPKGSYWHLGKYPLLVGPYILMAFYTVLTGWLMYYMVSFLSGDFVGMHELSTDTLKKVVEEKFSTLLFDYKIMILYTFLVIIFSVLICARGVQKGVEYITRPLMIFLLLLIVGLAIYCLTLDKALLGLKFYLYPNLEKVNEIGWIKVIYEALNQAFFTLSAGMGSVLIFGSYIDKKHSLVKESIIIAVLDTFVAITAGLIIFPACISYDISPSSGPTLLFISMLNVFGAMKYGTIVGAIFFIFMFFAAFTTVIAVIECIVANTIDCFKVSRFTSVIVNLIILLVISIPCILGFNLWSNIQPMGPGSMILDLEDFIVSNNILPIGCIYLTLFCVFGWKYHNLAAEVNLGKGVNLPSFMKYYISAFFPIVVSIVLILGYIKIFNS